MAILVFKTDMGGEGCKQTVARALNHFGTALCWTADLDDCDRILRVETTTVPSGAIIRAVHEAGFRCEELT